MGVQVPQNDYSALDDAISVRVRQCFSSFVSPHPGSLLVSSEIDIVYVYNSRPLICLFSSFLQFPHIHHLNVWVVAIVKRICCVSKVSIFRVKLFSKVLICLAITGMIPSSKGPWSSVIIYSWFQLRVVSMWWVFSIIPEVGLTSRASEQSRVWERTQCSSSVWWMAISVRMLNIWFSCVIGLLGGGRGVVVCHKGLREEPLSDYVTQGSKNC